VADGQHSSGWKKSSYSDTIDCVEVLRLPDEVLVRDSKNPDGDTLAISTAGWTNFLADIRDGKFDF
jgi:hypothetical protein